MDDSQPRILRAADYRREPWRNGAGWTRQVHAQGSQTPGIDWDWRLSIAEITAEAPFSAFPGIDRVLVLLHGNGLRLRFDDGEAHELLPPHDRLRFAGERALTGELIDGPTEDFNLMWRREAIDAQLWHRPLVGSMAVFAEPHDTWALHLLAGSARFSDDSGLGALAAGDTALLPGGDARRRYLLDGGGELLAIRITPLTPTQATARTATPGSMRPSR